MTNLKSVKFEVQCICKQFYEVFVKQYLYICMYICTCMQPGVCFSKHTPQRVGGEGIQCSKMHRRGESLTLVSYSQGGSYM